LGGDVDIDYSRGVQLSHAGEKAFVESLAKVWSNVSSSRAARVDLFVRFGVIPSAETDPKVLITQSLSQADGNWKLLDVRSAKSAQSGKRQAVQMAAKSEAVREFDFHAVRR
jgi:hypothetical protein